MTSAGTGEVVLAEIADGAGTGNFIYEFVEVFVDTGLGGSCSSLPFPPTAVAATTGTSADIELMWTASASPGVSAYQILRSSSMGGPYSHILSVPGIATTATDLGLIDGVTYFYLVRAFDGCSSIDSNEASATASDIPSELPFLTATSRSGRVELEWLNPADNYASTMVRYSLSGFPATPSSGSLLVDQAGVPGAKDSTPHTGLSDGTTVFYSAFVSSPGGAFSVAKQTSGRPFATTGPVKWVFSTGASALSPPGIGSVFAVSNDRALHSMTTGTLGGNWPSDWIPMTMNGPVQSRPPISPLTVGGSQKIALLSSQDGRTYAVNAENSRQAWSSPLLGTMLQGAPGAVFKAFGGPYDLLLVGTRDAGADNQIYGLNLADGVIRWSFDNGGGAAGMGILSGEPAVDWIGERVYFASRARAGGSSATVWALSFTDTQASLLWSRSLGDIDGSPILVGSTVYVGTNAGEVHALDAATGADLWSSPFATADGAVKSYVWPRFGSSELLFTTATTVWSIDSTDPTPTLNWSLSSIPAPSPPLYTNLGAPYVYVGSSDGRLYQLEISGATPTVTSVVLGAGTSTVGSPGLDVVAEIAYVGTEDGKVCAVMLPLP